MTYREAKSLQVLYAQINRAAPGRNRASDGWIGDASHASRTSDHNPWVKDFNGVGVVRARDFTHDPAGGLDCHVLADRLVALLGAKHPAMGSDAYVIWNRRIISTNRLREGWRPYTGSNPHTKHLHVSVGTSGYDSTKPWPLDAARVKRRPAAVRALIRAAKRLRDQSGPIRAKRVQAAIDELRKIKKQ